MVCTWFKDIWTSEFEPYLDLEKYILAIIVVLDGDLNIHRPSLMKKKKPQTVLAADSKVQRIERASGQSPKWYRQL